MKIFQAISSWPLTHGIFLHETWKKIWYPPFHLSDLRVTPIAFAKVASDPMEFLFFSQYKIKN